MKNPSDDWEELRRKVLGWATVPSTRRITQVLGSVWRNWSGSAQSFNKARWSFDSSSMPFLTTLSSWSRMGALVMSIRLGSIIPALPWKRVGRRTPLRKSITRTIWRGF